MKKRIIKHLWFCLSFAIVVVAIPIFVNGMMTMSCTWTANEPNDWIGFWGAYLGAIGSFVMALIAYKTLLKNDEQLKYIKEQNRPCICASVRKFLHQKENPSGQLYSTNTYYLSLTNHGIQIARNVHLEILLDGSGNAANERIASRIAEISNTHFDLPPNQERNFVLYEVGFPAGLSRQQVAEERKVFEAFEKLGFAIKVVYNSGIEEYSYEDTLFVRDTITDSTTIVQMLDYIDNNIKKLTETIKGLKE